LDNVPSLISPISGLYLSEFALHYLGMFVLSSLVRYRPQRWVHAITRSVTAENPSDDRSLALVEEFMARHADAMPGLLAEFLSPEPVLS
jgi:hypothetical protein